MWTRIIPVFLIAVAVLVPMHFTSPQPAPNTPAAAPAAAQAEPALPVQAPTPTEPAEEAAEETPDPSQLTLTTDEVVVFKDGYGLFTKTATATADAQGCVYTADVPERVALGCYWAVGVSHELQQFRADWHTTVKSESDTRPATSLVDILRANEGKHVLIKLVNTALPDIAGLLVDVLDYHPEPTAERELVASATHDGDHVLGLPPSGGQYVLLRTREGRDIILPTAQILSLEGMGLATETQIAWQLVTREKRLTFDLGPDAAGQEIELRIAYFTEGIRWIPTYRLVGEGEMQETVRLQLQGEVINEVEPIDGAGVNLVVGVPNFQFRDVISPLVLEQTMQSALVSVHQRQSGYASRAGEFRNSIMSQSSSQYMPDMPAGSAGGTDMAGELVGSCLQDLYVYRVPNLSLNNGARAAIPLWQRDVPVSHLYTFDVQIRRHARNGYVTWSGPPSMAATPNASPTRLLENRVWHQLELPNGGDLPWTTGPCLMLRDGLPLGQDLMTYTPVGGATLLPVTVATDLRGTHEEVEVTREPNALNWGGHNYARIQVRDTMRLVNFKDTPVDTRITLAFGGRPVTEPEGATIRTSSFDAGDWENSDYWMGRVNVHTNVEWRVELAPGESGEYTIEYEFYIW